MKNQGDDDEAARKRRVQQRSCATRNVETIFRRPHLLYGADWVIQRRCLFQVMQALSVQSDTGALCVVVCGLVSVSTWSGLVGEEKGAFDLHWRDAGK